jgi:hypothetical protein
MEVEGRGNAVVYPSTNGTDPYKSVGHVFGDGGVPPEFFEPRDFRNKEGITVLLQGCFTYKTFGRDRFSAYCFYVHPEERTPPERWSFRFCPEGNEAS